MKILATGAAGMLGTSLVPVFVAAGHDVVGRQDGSAFRLPDALGVVLHRTQQRNA